GRPVQIHDLRPGDRLTATIVTEHPPKVVTEQEVQASITPGSGQAQTAPVPPPTRTTTRPATGAAATGTGATGAPATSATGGTARTLPKTASPLPLVGATGVLSLAIAAALAALRRRRV